MSLRKRVTELEDRLAILEGQPEATVNWESVAFELWKLLDNIDSLSDTAGDDYQVLVEQEQSKRWLVVTADDVQVLSQKLNGSV